MKQPTQALGLALAIIATNLQANARVLDITPGRALIPLNYDPTFDNIPVAKVLNRVLGRWGIPVNLDLDVPLLSAGKNVSQAIKGHRRQQKHRRILGLKNVGGQVGGLVSPVANLLSSAVVDPLLGSNVVRARSDGRDSEWYGTLSFGNPPQEIKLNFDTGSSDLVLFAPTCTSCSLSNHTAFLPSHSSTYLNSTSTWSITYGDSSSASGYTSTDTASLPSLQLPQFLFALATSVSASSSWATSETSGLVGLAQDRLAMISGGRTVFSRLVGEGKLERDVLGVRLVKKREQVGGEGGAYAFGYVEQEWIVGGEEGLTWVGVTSSNYWGFPMDDVKMGGTSVLDSSTPRRAIIDTGTSLILTSAALAASIHAHIPQSYQSQSSGVWIIPCNQPSLPSPSQLYFTIANRQFGVPLKDLAWKALDEEGVWCVSGVQGGVEGFTILGAMFVKNHYVALRYDDREGSSLSVGIGERVDVVTMG